MSNTENEELLKELLSLPAAEGFAQFSSGRNNVINERYKSHIKKETTDPETMRDYSLSPIKSESFDNFPHMLEDNITDGAEELMKLQNEETGLLPLEGDSFSQNYASIPDEQLLSQQADLLFQHRHDMPLGPGDIDLGSSLNSSLYSDDVSTSSYSSSSFSFQPTSLHSQPQSAYPHLKQGSLMPNSIHSASSSLRNGNYLSASLRQNSGSIMSPTSTASPSIRQASVPNNHNTYLDSPVSISGSVPKTPLYLTAEEKLKRKREFHNAVEKRRRDLIKAKIKELAKLLPDNLLHYNDQGKKVQPNKRNILNRTVEYVDYLKETLQCQEARKIQLKMRIRALQDKYENIPHIQHKTEPDPSTSQEVLDGIIIDARYAPTDPDTTAQTAHQFDALYMQDALDFNNLNPDLQDILFGHQHYPT